MEEIKQELTAQLENPVAFTIPIGDGIPVSQSVVVTWILMAGLTLAAIALTAGRGADAMTKVGGVLTAAQTIILVISVVPVERTLKSRFD